MVHVDNFFDERSFIKTQQNMAWIVGFMCAHHVNGCAFIVVVVVFPDVHGEGEARRYCRFHQTPIRALSGITSTQKQ